MRRPGVAFNLTRDILNPRSGPLGDPPLNHSLVPDCNKLNLQFESRYVSSLPADPNTQNTCRQVRGACFSYVSPAPASDPRVIAISTEVADLLGIEHDWGQGPAGAAMLSGNNWLSGMKPYAACYGGHQFGNWAGQLGDGRAIVLGELRGRDDRLWSIQLKGAGRTPYSRSGDGLAVLRSSLREFLCSEAMYHLGVPTTRALSLVLTGDLVTRDMFYDGRPRRESGAIVCRVSHSFTRFGNFEILNARNDHALLKQLVDFTIEHDFPELDRGTPDVYRRWFEEVCNRTADMVVHWMRVGFVHGVMNTDNMSILGETIDYGPYGWLEDYDPNWTPNTTDNEGRRYAFGNQPKIAHWNLLQLANALWPIFEAPEPLQAGLDSFVDRFQEQYQNMMAQKLGFASFVPETDVDILEELDTVLQVVETDMTLFYRSLADIQIDHLDAEQVETMVTKEWLQATFRSAYYSPQHITEDTFAQCRPWFIKYLRRLKGSDRSDEERMRAMNQVNPIYVLRNYLAQQAIDAAEQGDYREIHTLLDLLRNPYAEQPSRESYAEKRPEWARSKPGCSTLSCSS